MTHSIPIGFCGTAHPLRPFWCETWPDLPHGRNAQSLGDLKPSHSGCIATLLEGSFDALRGAGVDDPAGLLAPLVRAALENSLELGFSALSGPLLRGDEETIAGHLEALAGLRPEILPPYRAMALATLDALERSGASVPPALRARLDQPRR